MKTTIFFLTIIPLILGFIIGSIIFQIRIFSEGFRVNAQSNSLFMQYTFDVKDIKLFIDTSPNKEKIELSTSNGNITIPYDLFQLRNSTDLDHFRTFVAKRFFIEDFTDQNLYSGDFDTNFVRQINENTYELQMVSSFCKTIVVEQDLSLYSKQDLDLFDKYTQDLSNTNSLVRSNFLETEQIFLRDIYCR